MEAPRIFQSPFCFIVVVQYFSFIRLSNTLKTNPTTYKTNPFSNSIARVLSVTMFLFSEHFIQHFDLVRSSHIKFLRFNVLRENLYSRINFLPQEFANNFIVSISENYFRLNRDDVHREIRHWNRFERLLITSWFSWRTNETNFRNNRRNRVKTIRWPYTTCQRTRA